MAFLIVRDLLKSFWASKGRNTWSTRWEFYQTESSWVRVATLASLGKWGRRWNLWSKGMPKTTPYLCLTHVELRYRIDTRTFLFSTCRERKKKINFLIGTWLGHGQDVVKIRTPTKLRIGETKKKIKNHLLRWTRFFFKLVCRETF